MSTNAPPFGGDLKLEDHASDKPVSETPPPPYHYEKGLVTTREWISENITSDFLDRVKRYLISLFPIFSWIYRYNLTWALGGTSCLRVSNRRSHRRFDSRRRGCASEYVICKDRHSTCRVRTVFFICGCVYLLFLCNFQGCDHWSCCRYVSTNSSGDTKYPAILSRSVHCTANRYRLGFTLRSHHPRHRTD